MSSTDNLSFVIKSENIFAEEDYGKPINEELSTILRRNVSKNDYANVAIQSKVSFSTIRDVVYRTNSLTKANAKSISLLVRKAFENCIAFKLQAERDTVFLSKRLNFQL